MSAPTAGSLNKFAIYNYTAGKVFTLKFKLRLGAADGSIPPASNGAWSLFVGDGNSYITDNGFSGGESFLGMQLIFGNGGAITVGIRVGSFWIALGTTSEVFQQGTNFIVEIYGNNSSTLQNYTNHGSQTVAANKWDLWVNGVLQGDELPKAALPGNTNIDSWMIYGESSTGNTANIFLDDIDYTNTISEFPLPVNLSSFNVSASGRNVLLNWITSGEVNNSGFYIERCKKELNTDIKWESITFVPGNGTTGETKAYTYSDNGLKSGTYLYRLKQVDFNGNYEYFQPQNNAAAVIGTPAFFEIKQNYPNPSNPFSKIDFEMPFDGNVSLKVYDISGKEVAVLAEGWRTADFYSVTFDGSNLASGVYFYRINANSGKESFAKTLKMILIK